MSVKCGLLFIVFLLANGSVLLAQNKAGRTRFEGPMPPPGKNGKPLNVTSPIDLSYLVPPIRLTPERKPLFKPTNYYIELTIDSTGSDSAGFAILPRDYRKQPIRFAGNKSILFRKYFESAVDKNKSLLPLTVVLKRYQIEEKQLNKADIEIKLALCFDVYFREDSQLFHLQHIGDTILSEGYVGFKREYDSLLKIQIREFLEITDEYAGLFRDFIKNMDNTQAFVQIAVPADENDEADTLYIDDKRYLQWSDFRGKLEQKGFAYGKYGLYLNSELIPKENRLIAEITIYPIFIRNSSWVDENVRSGRLLNHINYELLLTYSHALQLKKKLHKQTFPIAQTDELLKKIVDEQTDLLNIDLEKYAMDTQSGENVKAQAEWEEKIGNDIKKYNDN